MVGGVLLSDHPPLGTGCLRPLLWPRGRRCLSESLPSWRGLPDPRALVFPLGDAFNGFRVAVGGAGASQAAGLAPGVGPFCVGVGAVGVAGVPLAKMETKS